MSINLHEPRIRHGLNRFPTTRPAGFSRPRFWTVLGLLMAGALRRLEVISPEIVEGVTREYVAVDREGDLSGA